MKIVPRLEHIDALLFVDFDGVLHPYDVAPTQDDCLSGKYSEHVFCNAGRLEKALSSFPNLGIVATTGWRLPFLDCRTGLIDEAQFLRTIAPFVPEFLKEKMVGVTPFISAVHARYREICQFAEALGLMDMPRIILDDRDIYYRAVEISPHEAIVICDGRYGLTEAKAFELTASVERAMAIT